MGYSRVPRHGVEHPNPSGGQVGNRNAAKGRAWEGALRRALFEWTDKDPQKREALVVIAHEVVKQAVKGDPWAITEIANRLDGKPKERVEVTEGEKRLTYAERLAAESDAATATGTPVPPVGDTLQ